MANVRTQIGLGYDGVSPKYLHWIGLEVYNDFETNNESIKVKFCTYTEVNGKKLDIERYQYTVKDGQVLRTIKTNVIADTDANGNMLYDEVEVEGETVQVPRERTAEFTKNITFFTNPIWDPIISTMAQKYLELIPFA